MFDEEIILVRRTADGMGGYTEAQREIFAQAEAPTRAEFYAAMQSGLKLEMTFIVSADEYDGEEDAVIWRGKRLRTVRWYPLNRKQLKIVCKELP